MSNAKERYLPVYVAYSNARIGCMNFILHLTGMLRRGETGSDMNPFEIESEKRITKLQDK